MSQTKLLKELLNEKILVLDGAMGCYAPVAHVWHARECGPGPLVRKAHVA